VSCNIATSYTTKASLDTGNGPLFQVGIWVNFERRQCEKLWFTGIVFLTGYSKSLKQVGAQPDGRCDIRSSWIIADHLLMQFHINVHSYLVTAGYFRVCTW